MKSIEEVVIAYFKAKRKSEKEPDNQLAYGWYSALEWILS